MKHIYGKIVDPWGSMIAQCSNIVEKYGEGDFRLAETELDRVARVRPSWDPHNLSIQSRDTFATLGTAWAWHISYCVRLSRQIQQLHNDKTIVITQLIKDWCRTSEDSRPVEIVKSPPKNCKTLTFATPRFSPSRWLLRSSSLCVSKPTLINLSDLN